MKEMIEYNYNVRIDDICEGDCSIFFESNLKLYLLVKYKRNLKDLEDIVKISCELKQKNITSYDIILNKDNKIIALIDNENYILLLLNNTYKEYLDIIDIIKYNDKTKIYNHSEYKNNWDILWSEKNDYFEYQMQEIGCMKKIIKQSMNYFLSLAENAISLVKKINKNSNYGKGENIVLSHRRIFYPNYELNYFNPISYIIDLEVRDVAEYIKAAFYKKENAILELETYLKSVKLSNYMYQMLYARLLYPTNYFDLYEKVINYEESEEILINIISRVRDYELFLKDCYILITKYCNIENIEWLNN